MSPDPWDEPDTQQRRPAQGEPTATDPELRSRDQAPPQDVPAEQGVLGGMMLSKDAIADVVEVLTGGDFYRPDHELIFDAIIELYGRGEPADAVTVADELTKRGDVARAGGAAYLHTLISSVPTAANAGYYAHIVADQALLRRIVEAGVRIQQIGQASGGGDAHVLADAAYAEIVTATSQSRARTQTGHLVGDDLDDYLDQLETPQTEGLLWPFTDLNLACNPMSPGQMVVVGARPSVGKTSLGLDVARHVAINQKLPVLFHSLEMGRREIQDRIVAGEARVRLTNLITHKPAAEDWDKIAHAVQRLNDAQLVIDDSERLTLSDLRQSIRRHKPRLVVLDYLQLATVNPKANSRREAIEEFSRGVKMLAKSEQVPIIALAQLNRGPETRSNKRPFMSDLREAGAIEQDADVILLLHREDMYDRDSPRAGEADLIIAKQRNGSTGTVALGAQLHYARFCDLARF